MGNAIEVYEDNAGGLYLFETDGEDHAIRVFHGFEYGEAGNLKGFESFDLDLLDAMAVNVQEQYDYATDYSNGSHLIAMLCGNELGIYPDYMGAAGRRAFGIEKD